MGTLTNFEFGKKKFLKNLDNRHPDHSLFSEQLGKGLTVFRPPSVHAMQHSVKRVLHLHWSCNLVSFLDNWVTSKPISAETRGGDMVPAELMCENTNPDKLVPSTCTT